MSAGKTWRDLAREVFPDADADTLDYYLWEYTGFPGFFRGDQEEECRRQIIEARDAMARGDVFDIALGWGPATEEGR